MARRPSHTKPPPRRGPARPAEPARPSDRGLWLCAAAIVLLGALAYWNSLTGAFFLDDFIAIVDNPDIRRVWSLSLLRSGWGESSLLGRPLVTLTFAINYAIDGLNVTGYHAGNIAVHIICALALFGLIRRLCHSTIFAFACASVWTVHPLNTEVVDYISQRTESMMGVFYLLTIYASVRTHTAARPTRWLVAAVIASALGSVSKQSMVTVPVAVILVDVAFFFTSLGNAWRSRWRVYTAIALASWLVVTITVLVSPPGRSVGFSTGVSPWVYLLNQSVVITRYLGLTVWPRGLVADYGYPLPFSLADVLPQMLFVTGLVVLTGIALRFRPRLGLLGAWVFLTLGPTSSFAPIANEVGAERRMYLPLAALVVLGVLPLARLADHLVRVRHLPARTVAIALIGLWAAATASLTAGTIARNRDYASALRLAQVTFERRPNGQSRHNLANELLKTGRRDEATAHLREAIRDDPRAHFSLGAVLFEDGHLHEARGQLEEFVRQRPMREEAIDAKLMIGRTLLEHGQLQAAADQFRQALTMRPSFVAARLALGDALVGQGRFDEAIVEYRTYFAQGGGTSGAWINLGIAVARTGQLDSGIQALRRAVEIDPRNGLAHRHLAAMLLESGDVRHEALAHARRAVELRPADPMSHDLLGLALGAQNQVDEAIDQFREAVRLSPSDPEARKHLDQALRAVRNP